MNRYFIFPLSFFSFLLFCYNSKLNTFVQPCDVSSDSEGEEYTGEDDADDVQLDDEKPWTSDQFDPDPSLFHVRAFFLLVDSVLFSAFISSIILYEDCRTPFFVSRRFVCRGVHSTVKESVAFRRWVCW